MKCEKEKKKSILEERIKDKDSQFIFVGSINCLRHRPYVDIVKLMKEGRASVLLPSMTDFSAGRYINQLIEAVAEISKERKSKKFVLSCGCQWVILSTDGELICERLKNEYGIQMTIEEDSHLDCGEV